MEHTSVVLDTIRSPSGTGEPAVHLQASRDLRTGEGVFPAIPATSPSSSRYEALTLSDRAALYSFTVIHPNPKTGQVPFALVYADFPEKARVFGRLRLPEGQRPRIGMALRPVADATVGYAFIPAPEGQS
ncbi:Zn-ribbon domain-containing OB-fold protein [Roseomonas sp. WA12]